MDAYKSPTSRRLGAFLVGALASAFCAGAKAEVGTSSAAAAVIVPPSLLYGPSPIYPAGTHLEGLVELEATIDEVGRVSDVRIVRDLGDGLGQAAVEAALASRFSPAMEDGVPFAVRLVLKYRFVRPRTAGVTATPTIAVSSQSTTVTASITDEDWQDRIDPAFTVTVVGRRPPRSASDWTFALGLPHSAPPAGASGADILKKAPGVYISQHGGHGKGHQIFLRGFDAVHGQDVELTVGGIPVNEVSNTHGQGYADLHFMIPEVVKRMRVLAGSYDPRQGDFAVAGSLDFDLGLTRRGMFGRFTTGQYGLLRGVVAWGPEGEPDETFVAAEVARSDGFGPARAWNRASGIGQALVALSDHLDLRILASSFAGRFDSAGVITEADFEAGRVDALGTYDSGQGGASVRHQALLELTHRDGGSEATLSTYAILRDLRLRQNFTGFLLDPRGDRQEQGYEAFTTGARGTYARPFGERLRAELGISMRHDRVSRTERRLRAVDGVAHSLDTDDEVDVTDLGIFGDMQATLHTRLKLRTGARIEALSYVVEEKITRDGMGSRREAFGFHVAPKATLELDPIDDVRLFLSYGNGFRTPQATSLGQGERTPITEVHSGELGGRWAPSEALRTTLAGFTTWVAEDLVFDHATGQNIFAGPTLRGGGALLVESQPTSFLHASGSVTYTYAVKPDLGEQVPFVPPLVARLDLEAHDHLTELEGELLGAFGSIGATFLAPRPLPFSETADPVFQVDASAGLEWGPGSISVEVANLLGMKWRDSEFVYASSFNPEQAPSLVPRRTFTAGQPFTAQLTFTMQL